MINSNIECLQKIDIGEKKHTFMLSPFISQIYELTYEKVNTDWKKMIKEINFRKGDIICMQDGLGTSSFEPSYQLHLLEAIREAVKSDTKGLEFWLNVENYKDEDGSGKPSTFERYKLQLSICSKYAERLASFSYSHYYNPSVIGSSTFDKQYREYYTSITENTNIETENEQNENTNTQNNKIENGKAQVNNSGNASAKIDKTIANTIIPQAGGNNFIKMLIMISLIIIIITFIRYKISRN